MPKSYNSYHIVYRPRIEEFEMTKQIFLDSFVNKFKDSKSYIVSPESAGEKIVNHYDIYLRFVKEKRQDTMKKQILNIVKKYNLSNESVAVSIQGISRDEEFSIGYTIKEHDIYDNLIIKGISVEELDKCKKYFMDKKKEKSIKIDSIRVKTKNFNIVVKNYLDFRKELQKDKYTDSDMAKIFSSMARDDYELIPIRISNRFRTIMEYTRNYLNDVDVFTGFVDKKKEVVVRKTSKTSKKGQLADMLKEVNRQSRIEYLREQNERIH